MRIVKRITPLLKIDQGVPVLEKGEGWEGGGSVGDDFFFLLFGQRMNYDRVGAEHRVIRETRFKIQEG